jgi:transposase InsO family protein
MPSCGWPTASASGASGVERLIRQAAITGMVARKRGRTTIRVPGIRVCEDLVDRAFLAAAPNRLWVADITYLRTWEGWLYLVAVQDVFSRRIVGWSMADHMRTELVTDALQMALAKRRPDPGLIWHSDQGSLFVSLAFGQQARAAGIAKSMGSRGDCYDNAVAESFFATLTKSSSTAAAGQRRPSCAPKSSSTSRSSSTATADTPHSAFSRPEQFETITNHHPLEGRQPA